MSIVASIAPRHFPSHQLSIDHVQPRSRGGLTTWENLVFACLACNVKKGGRTPQEAKMKLARHPFKPKHNPLLALKTGKSQVRELEDLARVGPLGHRQPGVGDRGQRAGAREIRSRERSDVTGIEDCRRGSAHGFMSLRNHRRRGRRKSRMRSKWAFLTRGARGN